MISNLVSDAWLPVKRQTGGCELIAPWQLTETNNPVIALDAPRPDFNAALMQFLIGLLQTAATPENDDKWLDWLEVPPEPDVLRTQLVEYQEAFELKGDRGLFMQDYERLDNSGFNSIAELLIESPGGNTIKENKDHFIKRGQVGAMCESCAATALFTLQTNAPSGGQGHRTSLRGGGPLTTLLVVDERCGLPNDLWRNVWLNISDQQRLRGLTGDVEKAELSDIFPWMAQTRTSEKDSGRDTTPLDANPLQMYWGMPRRIRVEWNTGQSGHCSVCDDFSENLISQYQTKNYGINYTGAWQHPLSPHLLSKKGDLLPQHAQPGGMTYQHWLGLVDSDEGRGQFSALLVKRYRQLDWEEQLRLHVFGYDMDNMKARCWYETTFPLFTIDENIRLDFANRIQVMTDAAGEFAGNVRSCVKEAWFKRSGDAKGDTSFLMKSFYQHTETAFFTAAKALQSALIENNDKVILHSWHKTLLKAAFGIFDYWAAQGDIAQANPRRVAAARAKLGKLAYNKKIKTALQLPDKPKTAKVKKEAV